MRRLALTLLATLALAAAASAQPRRADDPEVRAALDALQREPSIRTVQQAALRFYEVSPETVSSLRRRAAAKSLAPEISTGYRYNSTDALLDQFDLVGGDPDAPALVDAAEAKVHEVEVVATWNLPRLVFNPEVLDVASLGVLQKELMKEVTELYYTRRRLQVDLILAPPQDPATRISRELRLEELTAKLDGMTGGLFLRGPEARR